MSEPHLSITEYAVLGVLAEAPRHGFAIAALLAPGSDVGRVFTVPRPLVYRALGRLVDSGLASAAHTEPGDAGPRRVVHRITPSGRRQLAGWLGEPVAHLRDMRIEFQLKVTLLIRTGSSPRPLIDAQRRRFEPAMEALAHPEDPLDHLEMWRRHTASAVAGYLDELGRIHSE